MGMLDDVPNSSWGNCTHYTTEELLNLSVSTRPWDIFHFVQEKPKDQRFPVATRDGVKWIATPEESRYSKLADVVTLDLWTEVIGDPELFLNDNYGINMWAEVEWGSGGTNCKCRVDIRRGTQLTLPSDCITVRAGCDAMPATTGEESFPWTPMPVSINCLVGKHAASSGWRAQRGIYVPVVSPASSVIYRIPDFANGIRVAAQRAQVIDAGVTVEVVQNESATAIVYESWTALQLKDSPLYAPLPNGAEFVRLSNTSNVAPAINNVTLEFNLST